MGSAKQSPGRTNGAASYHRTLYNSTPNANVPPHGAASSFWHVFTPSDFAQPNTTPVANWPNADDFGSGSIKEEVIKIFRQTFGIEPKAKCRSYQRPYPENYDYAAYPEEFKILNLLNSLVMIVKLHWSILVNLLYNVVKVALMIFTN